MKRHFSWDILIYHNLAQTCYFLHIFPGIGKSLSEALIFASTNPQHDDRLFIELQVQYKKTTSSVHVLYTNCSECPKCGLVDARINASAKDLPICLQVYKSAKNLDL